MRAGAFGKSGNIDSGTRKRPVEFLTPVSHVTSRTVAIDHAERSAADIRELMEDTRGNVNHLASSERLAFLAETHFAGSLDDEVNLFLLLIVPWHLTAIGIKSDIAHREVRGLNGSDAAREILGAAAGRITTALHFCEIGNSHNFEKCVSYYFAESPPKKV